ncbi:MAG: YncE family protein, partial [Acidobacteriota bacterium]
MHLSVWLRRTVLPACVLIPTAAAILHYGPFTSQAGDDLKTATETTDDRLRPAGTLLLDAETELPAVVPLTVGFVRTPDAWGPDGRGRYLIAINSGFGLEFNSRSKGNQSLSVIDLNAKPEPIVIQNIYFQSPQSANVGLAIDKKKQPDGSYRLYVAGGYENKVWMLAYDPEKAQPLYPANKPDTKVDAPSIDVSAFAESAPSPYYNDNIAAVYPTGLALSPDGQSLYSANNLSDNLGIVSDLRASRRLTRIPLRRPGSTQFVYPYDVTLITTGPRVAKVYVSLWGDGSIASVEPAGRVRHITVDRHPTKMLLNKQQTRLYVVNSNADAVSVIDTRTDAVIERVNVRLSESAEIGASPEGLALSEDEQTLFVANAHANAVGVVSLTKTPSRISRSKLLGFIPTGKYPSAVAVIGKRLFVANGKGTGVENSSNTVNDSGRNPNMPNGSFPATRYNKRGQYSASVVSGNISLVSIPDAPRLYEYTQRTMRQNGLLGREKRSIFADGRSPFKHVIYVIRENRTYDQVFGDLAASGNGSKADGEPAVAIFGAGESARSPKGESQNITPNARALALRFGLLDRFFVNAEASPDGHNWSTAAFSNDYVDKAFRWDYSGRGRTYDYEGFNRLPSFDPSGGQPPVALPFVFDHPATAEDVANFQKKFAPDLNGDRDIAEPETRYLWDAARRAGLSYRNYGEFVATVSEDDVKAHNERKSKRYPDVSPNATAFPTKRSLEGHFSRTVRNFDQSTPDSFTTESYTIARRSPSPMDPAIRPDHPDVRFRGSSRLGEWLVEFNGYVRSAESGAGEKLPDLSIVRLSNDHTSGLRRNTPTPQFYVAENDYALGRLVEAVSKSPYWRDTAIFVVEDDAQNGPDHVDAHR